MIQREKNNSQKTEVKHIIIIIKIDEKKSVKFPPGVRRKVKPILAQKF